MRARRTIVTMAALLAVAVALVACEDGSPTDEGAAGDAPTSAVANPDGTTSAVSRTGPTGGGATGGGATGGGATDGGATGATASTGGAAVTGPAGGLPPTGATGGDEPTFVELDRGNTACRLLTPRIAGPIVDVDLGVAGDVTAGIHSSCILRDRTNTISVELRITTGREAEREYEALEAQVAGRDGVRELDGFGDRAFRAVAGPNAHVIVLAGRTLLRLSIVTRDVALADESLTLAREVLDRR